ncbi:cold shock protein [Clostridium sartagoforme AAU1]|jgi:cold shock protein|uniref:Cold shock protein n=1 Tax=Clostridium sartagoforme AAU1 TaxID=1202534 RepID=R9BWP1_9CLOT|nr:cold shock domain-containing protein [Clostridium sartagoforme]EOR21145.1 cold shock protein [Clostridium sartagoforme AAU1]
MANITGVVKWFDNERGYGFISCEQGNDVFVHHSQVKENGPDSSLHEGENVSFDIKENEKGPMAVNVHKL